MAKSKKSSAEPDRFTKYEKARILGSRALQISMGAPYLVKISAKKLEEIKYNPLEIARMEFDAGVVPIDIVRSAPVVPSEQAASETDQS